MKTERNQKTKKKNILMYISRMMIVLLIIFIVTQFKKNITMTVNNMFFNTPIENINLTTKEKLSDFDSFYDIIITSFPNVDEVKNIYSIDFKAKYDYYCELIKQTDSDFAYYCTMTAIIEDLASYHTGFCFPDYENIKELNCYNLNSLLADKNLKPYANYWNNVIKEGCEKYADVNVAEFKYIDGEYIYDSKWSSEKYDNLQGYHVVSIDNVNTNTYILDNVSIYKIQYDTIADKPYRRVITFNESVGEKVKVIFENQEGNKLEHELYISLEMEIVNTYSAQYFNNNKLSVSQNIRHNYDEEDDILYVSIKNFNNSDGEKLKDIFKDIGDNTKIIIDLRDNYGGNPNYAKKNIYPYLYNQEISFEQSWFVPTSKYNDKENKKLLNKLLYKTQSTNGGMIYKVISEYRGKDKNYSNNIYYLVNKGTASAADEYVAMIRENGLGTVVGTDTAGEGLGGSFFVYMLENSGWVFTYYPCQAYNSEKRNNAIFGTSPDIYINQSTESFNKQRQLEDDGIDIESYECRLIWDNVLIETVDIINKTGD